MDKATLAEMLGVQAGGVFQISAMRLAKWGNEIVFRCTYAAENATPLGFEIVLRDCREMQWRVYVQAGSAEVVTVVNLRLGSDQHRKPLSILTDAFGLTVLYGEMTLTKS